MSEDERMWGRLYNKEEEEKRMWEGIRREERENAMKEGIEQGIKQGIEQGIEQGKTNKEKQLIQTMYNNCMTIEEISKVTNIDKEKIEELLK